jgi:hypothetical protein
MTGPLDGKNYRDVMVPMDNTDEWIAGIASFVRTSFGNTGDMVTPADVARVRAATASRKDLWTVPEIEASLPKPIESQDLKLTASAAPAEAPNALTLRGWSSEEPQSAGMWFQIELPQAMLVNEVQFDSATERNPGARAARGGAGAPGAAVPAAAGGRGPAARGAAARGGFGGPPIIGYPRGYSVQTSMDGKSWSKPVAQGKGDDSHTSIAFTPTRAKFIRITQTETLDDAPSWSINNLRVYQAAARK